MERIPTKIIVWVCIYWILLVNLLVAFSSPILTGFYDYSFIISNSIFALICATIQLHIHLVNGKQPVTFYHQFIYFYLVTSVYLFFDIFVLADGAITFHIVIVLLFVSFLITIPLTFIALFVYQRILKYDTE